MTIGPAWEVMERRQRRVSLDTAVVHRSVSYPWAMGPAIRSDQFNFHGTHIATGSLTATTRYILKNDTAG
jgi:hypothetical protein